MSLRRRGGRLRVNQVLEMIHRHAIGKKQQGTGEVDSTEMLSTLAEKLFHVGPGEEFQPHRVDFAGLVRRPEVVNPGLITAHVALESVPHFVGEDFHVAPRAIEVCIDEGHADGFKRGAEATSGFPVPRLEIHETAVQIGSAHV